MLVKHVVNHHSVLLVYILICYVISGALLVVIVILFHDFDCILLILIGLHLGF